MTGPAQHRSSLTGPLHALYKAALTLYHRAESHGVEKVPDSGALLVGNHSGGAIPMDVPAISVAMWERFGEDTALHTLAHDIVFMGPLAPVMRALGLVPASRESAAAALRDGGFVIVFPGGDVEVNRSIWDRNRIVFSGRTGYVSTAIEAGVPIVPVVSIGGQEAFLILVRSSRLAKLMGPLSSMLRIKEVPVVVGFPWGVNLGWPPPLPLPSKIVTRFLDPIDPVAEFGPDPEPALVDELVRTRMQAALDELASERRLPVLG